jgi:hypothetical protein
MKSTTTRRLVALVVALGTFGAASGCKDPRLPTPHLYEESFEARCGGRVCWEQVSGPEGSAVFGPTIHSAVGGVTLRGVGATIRGPAGDARRTNFLGGGLEIHMAARCDVGDSLLVQLVVQDARPDGGGVVDSFDGRVSPTSDFGPAAAGNPAVLTGTMSFDPGSPFGMGAPFEARVSSILITKSGRGNCTIDRIVVDDIGETRRDDRD